MNILIVTHYFPPHTGGIEMVAYNQAQELSKKGHKVTIITSNIPHALSPKKVHGVRIVRVSAWNVLEHKFDVPFPIFSYNLISELNREMRNCDVVHAHGALYQGSLFASLLTRLHKKPFFVTEHVGFVEYKSAVINMIERIAFLTIGRITLGTCQKIFVLNKDTLKFIQQLTTRPIEHLDNGIDTNLFHPASETEKREIRRKYRLPEDRQLVLFVGRFVEKKGVDLLMQAKSKHFSLVLVGSGKISLAKNNNDVYIFNILPQEKLAEVYRACDVFVLPSKSEGMPLALQEAMASGLPIITTKNNHYKKIFNTKNVRLIEQNIHQIKLNIEIVIKNINIRKNMEVYSRKFILQSYSWTNHVNNLLETYQEVIS